MHPVRAHHCRPLTDAALRQEIQRLQRHLQDLLADGCQAIKVSLTHHLQTAQVEATSREIQKVRVNKALGRHRLASRALHLAQEKHDQYAHDLQAAKQALEQAQKAESEMRQEVVHLKQSLALPPWLLCSLACSCQGSSHLPSLTGGRPPASGSVNCNPSLRLNTAYTTCSSRSFSAWVSCGTACASDPCCSSAQRHSFGVTAGFSGKQTSAIQGQICALLQKQSLPRPQISATSRLPEPRCCPLPTIPQQIFSHSRRAQEPIFFPMWPLHPRHLWSVRPGTRFVYVRLPLPLSLGVSSVPLCSCNHVASHHLLGVRALPRDRQSHPCVCSMPWPSALHLFITYLQRSSLSVHHLAVSSSTSSETSTGPSWKELAVTRTASQETSTGPCSPLHPIMLKSGTGLKIRA